MHINKIKRNIFLYIVGVFSLSITGGIVIATTGNDAGGLLFIIGPIMMMVLLRALAGDGWDDAGIGLKLKKSWKGYVFALVAYPLTFAIVVTLGVLLGITTFVGSSGALLSDIMDGMGMYLASRMLFAMFEELGWRGYLEPRLIVLGVADLQRHLFVGFIWALWHFPWILATDYTTVPYWIFLPLFVIGVMISSVVYGQLRKITQTVWTSVIMHGVANTVAWTILQNKLVIIDNKVLANITPESILVILLWGGLAWWMLSRKKM